MYFYQFKEERGKCSLQNFFWRKFVIELTKFDDFSDKSVALLFCPAT